MSLQIEAKSEPGQPGPRGPGRGAAGAGDVRGAINEYLRLISDVSGR